MDRNLRGALWAVGATVVGAILTNIVIYPLGVEPGDRTDLLIIGIATVIFASLGFWWGRRTGGST